MSSSMRVFLYVKLLIILPNYFPLENVFECIVVKSGQNP